MHSYYILQNQLRAQSFLQFAVFKKVTRLSAAALADNSAGQVSSFLSADSWLVAVSTYYLPNAIMGVACVPVALAVLARQLGYVPACSCLVWLVIVGAASFSMEPLLNKYCNVLYKYRDERLKKFAEFLSVVRLVKMSALEDVFQRSLHQLRLKEINQAYRVNILDGFLETLISASTSVMIMLAFGSLTFMNPDGIFSQSIIYSSVYILTLMDAFTNTMAHATRLKSPVFRSCRRLMSFFAEEEWLAGEREKKPASPVSVGEIAMKECSFAWSARDCDFDSPVLAGIDLRLESGSLVGVVGPVGSGKSSLLSAIVGDTKCLGGSLAFNGKIAVVCQRPHVFNMTIRDNIVFGHMFDEIYYEEVLEACQMIRDMERFPAGDLSEAGEKGEMLSGGQRQRVALARAVYSRSDIYLLDDPTSSQDFRVARGILDCVIGPRGLLGDKTRILVTTNTRLPFPVDKWLLMHNGRAVLFRDLNDLKKHPGAPQDLEEPARMTAYQSTENTRQVELHSMADNEVVSVVKEEGIASSKGALGIYAAYIKYSGISTVLALVCFVVSAVFMAAQLVCIKAWSSLRTRSSEDMEHSSREMLLWLALACLGDVVFRLVAGILLARGTRHCSLTLHRKMLARVAGSPLSFFDATPRGRLLNRFSVDLEMNDSRAFVAYKQLFQSLLCVIGRLAVIGTQAPIVFALAFSAELVLVISMRCLIRGSVIGRLYESTRLSKVLQHLAETLDSVGVIRCYQVMDRFCLQFRRLLNDYAEAFNVFFLCYSFSRLLFTFAGVLVINLTMAIVVVPNHGQSASASTVGLSVLSSFTVPFAMSGVMMVIFWATQGYVALERALEYAELPVEEARLEGSFPETATESQWLNPRLFLEPFDEFWPKRGVVKFDHFSASYRPGVGDDALKDICFEAHAGEKLAVVGRTGAGKSSLVLALLRIIQRTSGAITIDGTGIYDVPLKRLRSAIAIIPQDPSLFCGTLRENLDPPSSRSDAELWSVLRTVGLDDFVDNGAEGLSFTISEKGDNLSAGQRQLVSLARALLRATKILVLDEATSSMDPETDRRIQATLRESFSHCTLITIAHRIDSILDYDRVVVMDDGRVVECGRSEDLLADPRSRFRQMVTEAGLLPE
ncbi:multidrug resistance protein mrp-7-like [Amblyomma americanum]